ncbi:sulfite exporter TauE/SafE family protein [Waddlia chondrophila]|uniref:Urease accessory protein UreH-like transmembrane domain-containing protein n=1 Tax=Waddlia chondrophila (strain ATCC VR-1470 / WSU 86-1044) TaxID=716544 RepID=D6YU44_WADCW|nr:sulfite exporter TauE/SafE family protein [Waddlia chondrophila]ADI37655.1 conserved hypothetical protein [Waddlia chondrophila WSU 86-1044]
MSLLFTMLPVYLLGNLHCLGMCGPIVAFLGKHRFRYAYFLGRLLSFSFAGLAAGELGAVFHIWLKEYNLSALVSIGFGFAMACIGLTILIGREIPGNRWLGSRLAQINHSLSLLLLKDSFFSTALFGFATILLPCGQTLVVYSACALSQSGSAGLLNGFAFGLLTTPSLWLAMHASRVFGKWKGIGNRVLGGCAMIVGLLAVLRGVAEFAWIPHFILNEKYHIALY